MFRKNYTFDIDGVNTDSLLAQRDFELGQQERIDLVNNLLYDQDGYLIPYLATFFDDKVTDVKTNDFSPSNVKPLSSEINVCNCLETFANYILYSPDGERLDDKCEYNFYTDKQAFKNKVSELSISSFSDTEEAIDFLEDSTRNHVLDSKQKIYKSDLVNYSAVAEYEKCICGTFEKMKKIKNSRENEKEKYKLGREISELRKDQKAMKEMLQKSILFKHISKNLEKSPEEEIDNFDYNSVKHMFTDKNTNFYTPFGKLIDIFRKIMNEIEVNAQEKIILDYIYYDCVTNFAIIARKLEINNSLVHQSIIKIRNKIIKEYIKKYEDWHYTFIDYGWYKKCNSCKEVKLLSSNYWQKDPSSNDGFKSICKKCKLFS
jgi:hypothetical protein